ncbi:hypothetical protein [Micromonospora sp. WMMD1155]|uniref:hypothetical protein n=1 Tax=Micromonospora sp. WMMD1155 TaxID=3016094 RepID=UPI00249BDBED|nr:hypothetical protein [Micromonospora sp. WMMD1155]WFE54734.1 hypothetical protein O7617_32210 [Micromonospora sp. WMMD1155]
MPGIAGYGSRQACRWAEHAWASAHGVLALPPEVPPARAADVIARDLGRALPLYAELHPILGWAPRPESVQAVKLAMACAGRFGGRCRPPRGPLPVADADRLRRDVLRALAATVEPASGGRPRLSRRWALVLQVSEVAGPPADICTVTGTGPCS